MRMAKPTHLAHYDLVGSVRESTLARDIAYVSLVLIRMYPNSLEVSSTVTHPPPSDVSPNQTSSRLCRGSKTRMVRYYTRSVGPDSVVYGVGKIRK